MLRSELSALAFTLGISVATAAAPQLVAAIALSPDSPVHTYSSSSWRRHSPGRSPHWSSPLYSVNRWPHSYLRWAAELPNSLCSKWSWNSCQPSRPVHPWGRTRTGIDRQSSVAGFVEKAGTMPVPAFSTKRKAIKQVDR